MSITHVLCAIAAQDLDRAPTARARTNARATHGLRCRAIQLGKAIARISAIWTGFERFALLGSQACPYRHDGLAWGKQIAIRQRFVIRRSQRKLQVPRSAG